MIRIYITNLRKYNEGNSLGRRLEIPASDEEVTETLKEIVINEECSEYFLSDFECNVPEINIKINSSIDDINEIADHFLDMNEEEVKVCSTIKKMKTVL